MKSYITIILLSLLFSACMAAIDNSCLPTISQYQQSTWRNDENGPVYSLWRVEITATTSALSSIAYSVQGGSFYQVWELVLDSGVYVLPQWRQQNGGIAQGATHSFGYITAQESNLIFVVNSLVCSSTTTPPTPTQTPTSSPSTPSPTAAPSTPSPSPSTSSPSTPSPTQVPTQAPEDTIGQAGRFPPGVCSTVVVIDSYIVRNSGSQSIDEIKQKYSTYFADVQKYYQATFNIDLQFTYYVEEGSSFSDSLDGGEVLEAFSSAIQNQVFGNPVGQCLYHLLTARQPYGIGGLAYVGSACNDFSNTGLTVDGYANEDPELVIRRAIHEIGHNFGGDHPDRYTAAPNDYSCSVGEERESDRILRSVSASPNYQYLSSTAFISDCAIMSIRDSLSAFTCLYPIYVNNPVYPQTILCEDVNAEKCHVVQSYNGDEACYNILAFNDAVSSFQLFPGKQTAPRAVGLRLYADVDCRGSAQDIFSYYASSLPPNANDSASSFKFIVQ